MRDHLSFLPSRVEPVRRCTSGPWCAELLPKQGYDVRYTPDAPVIGFAFDRQTGCHAFASDRSQPFTTRPNSFAYLPPGCQVVSVSDQGGEYLRLTGLTMASGQYQYQFNDHIDPAVVAAAYALRRLILTQATCPDPLILEHHGAVMADRLGRVFTTVKPQPSPARWMTMRRRKVIEDLIETELDQGLTVRHLAATLGLSEGFFTRAFKAAIGKAPYDYIIDRRLARARRLLATLMMDLSMIALMSGFSSHAHMTAVFTNRLGISPSSIRNELQANSSRAGGLSSTTGSSTSTSATPSAPSVRR